jgi:OmpA-OmpF porin, OOP family
MVIWLSRIDHCQHHRPSPKFHQGNPPREFNKMIIKQILTLFAVIAVVAGCSNSPSNTTGNFRNQGYLLDTAGGNAVVKAQGYDTCVRTGDWTPARAIVDCDPDLVPKPVVTAPPAPPAPKPAPPAPPKVEAKAPPPPPPAPKPVPQRFTISTDTLFDFDRITLRPDGRRKLDEVADALRGTQHDTITVTGHTDRVGTVKYNQNLSERRADSVKRYLQEKGLDVGKISASGKGKSQPVTKPNQCPRGMPHAALFACLQPDRRVEIEASGTKIVDPNAPAAARPAAPPAKPAADSPAAANPALKGKPAAKKPLVGL